MRNKDKKKETENLNEPWEQPIYNVEDQEDQMPSRMQQGRRKRGNSKFLTIVLLLLFLIAACPAAFGIWKHYVDNQPKQTQTTKSSTKKSSASQTKESSATTSESTTQTEETQTSSSEATIAENQEATENAAEQNTQENQEGQNSQNGETTTENGAEYTTVQAGEGPATVASRTGVSVEDIYRLNGMTADNFHLTPGQQIRIK
ncbi:LysM peptidoglycan-binding domain-containing protein [Enterococcus cecorum]|uniref:LysM peptidoglycan-binding domain-containing protein n=1 Tax=Enterococcus cecorum TaxID=44008 RepID=UPI000A7A8523|nr:LysM domain-containing protein [Enterococcus cecorum]MCJ0594088.1 LysM peptidoglycan-binding domain-containing protein [Enterococcus cecorum]MCJ0596488.1 LysM peptidoglycan-binding domain-containing protein [Enterococcus cecorum]MCJ0605848.1 LysM peptidoglycan-binding domain-containing protein [Enterococcus cecorum]CAI3410106.1 LysM peptidoglycan-binding domain-containing protein [Enterococcus cecorum]